MTQIERVYSLLSDGKPHTTAELKAVSKNYGQDIYALRRKGFNGRPLTIKRVGRPHKHYVLAGEHKAPAAPAMKFNGSTATVKTAVAVLGVTLEEFIHAATVAHAEWVLKEARNALAKLK